MNKMLKIKNAYLIQTKIYISIIKAFIWNAGCFLPPLPEFLILIFFFYHEGTQCTKSDLILTKTKITTSFLTLHKNYPWKSWPHTPSKDLGRWHVRTPPPLFQILGACGGNTHDGVDDDIVRYGKYDYQKS